MTATIAFLGTGSMNGSIAAGLLAAGHDPAHIRATVRSEESRAALAQRLGDKVEIITTGGEADGNHKAFLGVSMNAPLSALTLLIGFTGQGVSAWLPMAVAVGTAVLTRWAWTRAFSAKK